VTEDIELKRSLSFPLIMFYGLGTILGAGIYVLVGKVAGHAGLYAPISFFVASALAAFSAFSYAELSGRYPKSAGEAVYVYEALGSRPLSVLVGLLIVAVGIVSTGTMANGLIGYVQLFVDVPRWLIISALVLGLGLLAAWGIRQSVIAATLITVVEVFGLLLVLWVGRGSLSTLPARWPELVPNGDSLVWVGILLGAFLAFYAYIGYEDMVNVAEEVKTPTRNLPLAILTVLAITTLLYVSVSLVAVLAVPPEALATTGAPMALVFERATGTTPTVIALISVISVVNGALIQVIMAARILFGLSRQGWLPRQLGTVHPMTRTPLVATSLITGLILVFSLWLPLVALARATSFITLTVFALVNFALWWIKRRIPRVEGVLAFPRWVPFLGLVANLSFVVFQAYHSLVR
jgi:APA family basic amino acid/polyamine antiporter